MPIRELKIALDFGLRASDYLHKFNP